MDSQSSWTHVHEQNRKAWDRLVDQRNRFARPASDQDCHDPLAAVDGLGWLGGNIEGKELLCLAAGGGRQSAIYASAGARVTVVDISPGMLELDREVARERRLDIHVVEASMDDLRGLTAQSFDIVIHPVSTCYVPDVVKVFQQVARVIKGGGVYISQHKSPVSLQATIKPGDAGYVIQSPYYSKQAVPKVSGTSLREEGCLEFVHRWGRDHRGDVSLWFCDRRFGRADARQAGITTGRIWSPGSIHRPLSSDQGKAARTGRDAKLRFESRRVMAAAVMRYGDKMPLDGSGSAGWQGVSGIGLLEGDRFATLLHGRFVFCRNFTRRLGITRGIMDAKRGLEGHHQNQWKILRMGSCPKRGPNWGQDALQQKESDRFKSSLRRTIGQPTPDCCRQGEKL